MASKPKQFQVRFKDGTVRIVLGHSLRGAARKFCMEYDVHPGDTFSVKERLTSDAWEVFTRTKVGIRSLGTK